MELPNWIVKNRKGLYVCLCSEKFETTEEACSHVNNGIAGFCENGLKRNESSIYECYCGHTDTNVYKITWDHWYLNKGKCCKKRMLEASTLCKKCNVACNSVAVFERHCDTKRHIEMSEEIKNISLDCAICDIKCRGQKEMIAHLKTKKHIRLSSEKQLPLTCDICNISVNSQKQMKTHLATKKHMKNENLNRNPDSC